MSKVLHSRLLKKLEFLIRDPNNYLYQNVIEIKTKIDLKDELEPLKNYEGLIKTLDDFQSERKKVIEDNIERIKNHYSHRIEYSKMLESKDKLFKDEIEANIPSLNYSIVNLKMAIMNHEKISFNGSQIIRTPVDCEENLKNLIEPKLLSVQASIDRLIYLKERQLEQMTKNKPKSDLAFQTLKAYQERRYEDLKSSIFKDKQFIESLVAIGRHTQNHRNSISNILKLESLKLDN